MSRSQREKGKRGEREAAAYFAALLGGDVRRSAGQARQGGDAPDLVGLPFGLWCECKIGKKPNWRGALAQAEEAAPDGALPIVWARDDRDEAVIVMRAKGFAELLAEVAAIGDEP